MSEREPKEFSRTVENLIADLRELPGDRGRSKRRKTTELGHGPNQLRNIDALARAQHPG